MPSYMPIDLALHVFDDVQLKEIRCPHCEKDCRVEGVTALLVHILTMHLNERKDNIDCSACTKTFEEEKDVEEHVEMHKGMGVDATWSRMAPNWKNTALLQKAMKLVDFAVTYQFTVSPDDCSGEKAEAGLNTESHRTSQVVDSEDQKIKKESLQKHDDRGREIKREDSATDTRKREETQRRDGVPKIPLHWNSVKPPVDPRRDLGPIRFPVRKQLPNPPFARGWKYLGRGQWKTPRSPSLPSPPEDANSSLNSSTSSSSSSSDLNSSLLGKRKCQLEAVEAPCAQKRRSRFMTGPPADFIDQPGIVVFPHTGPHIVPPPPPPVQFHGYADFGQVPVVPAGSPFYMSSYGFRVYARQDLSLLSPHVMPPSPHLPALSPRPPPPPYSPRPLSLSDIPCLRPSRPL